MTNDESQQSFEAQISRFRWDTGDTGDGVSLPPDRQAQLIHWQYTYQQDSVSPNTPTGIGPFAGRTLTGAEVYWLAARFLTNDARVGKPEEAPEQRMRRAFKQLRKAKTESLLRVSLDFSGLNLNGAILSGAHLAGAVLGKAQLIGAVLGAAHLEVAYLGGADLRDAFLDRANLTSATLPGVHLQGASMRESVLIEADLGGANLDDAILRHGKLAKARLNGARLHDVDLRGAELQEANFIEADLTDAFLYEAHVEGALFTRATLVGCDLRRTTFDADSRLNDAKLNQASLEQAYLQDTNLAVVEWRPVKQWLPVKQWRLGRWREITQGVARLGDEIEADEGRERAYVYELVTPGEQRKRSGRQTYEEQGKNTEHETRIKKATQRKTYKQRAKDYRAAERAYRALSARLDEQGLARDAARFQFRAELMSRNANFFQGYWLSALVSLVLGWFAGYGIHQIWRLFVTYIVIVLGFAGYYMGYGYYMQGQAISWTAFVSALLLSVTTLHGRGFSMLKATTDVVFAGIATIEAVLGVLVEALLVAALVRRITGD